jgi:regulator of sirC expression with transglutaminase-like and TPR domain
LSADGVGLPGHFIVRVGIPAQNETQFVLIDPFNGARPIDLEECRIRVESLGQPFVPDEHLKSVPAREILARMCNNLLALFDHQKKILEAERVVTVLSHLQPRDPIPLLLRAERRLRRGERKGARADFERARAMDPNGPVGRTAEELLRRMGYENPFS